MCIMMSQLYILSKKFMEEGTPSVNVVGVRSTNPDDITLNLYTVKR